MKNLDSILNEHGRIPVSGSASLDPAELEFWAARSSGPGGQHVNTTSSAVTVSFNVAASGSLSREQKDRIFRRLGSRLTNDGRLLVTARDFRSQHANRKVAVVRLAELLAWGLVVPKKRKPTKPSAGAKRRRLAAKRRRSMVKGMRKAPGIEE